jgi:hypothetical protein
VDVLWSKYRWYCEEPACDSLSFFESTPQVPRRARSTSRFRDQLVDAVIRSGRAVSETAAGFAVSWWMVRAALNEACLLRLPDVDKLNPRMLGIDEHRFRSVRYFQDPESKTWTRFEPWMTTIVDLDSGPGPGRCRRPGPQGRRGLAFRAPASLAAGRAGRCDRPVCGLPQGVCGCGFPAPLSLSITST